MKEQNILTEQGKVYYWISDNWDATRDTIFFFPGLTADHTMFDGQIDYFAEKYNLIVWDAPCHGKSRPYSDFSFENTSEIISRILNEMQVETMIAIGQSLGGYYVQAFAWRFQERVKAFVGIGTTPYGEGYYSNSDKFWLRRVKRMAMCFPFGMLKYSMSKAATRTEVGYKNMMSMIAPYEKNELCTLMQIAYDAMLEDNRDIDLKCPVLITYGAHDMVGKVRQYCKMWKKRTGFPCVVVEGAGHNANVDKPEEMNRIIQNFLDANFKQ